MSAGLRFWSKGLAVLGVLSALPIPASGIPFSYPDMTGTTVLYTGISEESVTDPSLALFGAPTITGDELVFSPSLFSAVSDFGGVDQRVGAFSISVHALPLQGIHTLRLRESGTYTLLGSAPDVAEALVGGALIGEVIEIDGGAVAPGLDLRFEVPLNFSGGSGSFTLGPSPEVEAAWSGSAGVDIDALLASRGASGTATRVQFSMANDTLAAISASGTQARIEKNSVAVAANVPEPSSLGIVIGLAALVALHLRRRR
ncbi:MAG: PEP-CTERM sorting domain-containing protein [Myxococcota bacterium]|nr:PEP-CTERM sorting domain-containing protein [Myxococcota bacterium]